jgi:hypothetical protein
VKRFTGHKFRGAFSHHFGGFGFRVLAYLYAMVTGPSTGIWEVNHAQGSENNGVPPQEISVHGMSACLENYVIFISQIDASLR